MKNRFKGLLVAAAVAGTIAGVAPTAQASPVSVCSHFSWGGQYVCDLADPNRGETWWNLSDGTRQLFVIGIDGAVWTRWSYPGGSLSSWQNFGGKWALDTPYIAISPSASSVTISVMGIDGRRWYKTRPVPGSWGDWVTV
ncbi:hypothetical protein ACFVUH_13100 [Kitasatospora sp. NPDC058032]|uniref:hypothetical protein n=1 Tax=Kitasatospora sp. NPDC058032 TaxID=3346307 RepID=UPI0036DDA095